MASPLEVLIAIALIAGALSGLARLMAIGVRANAGAQIGQPMSSLLAVQKMEQLRAEATTLATGGSLQSDANGFVDFRRTDGRDVPGVIGDQGVSFCSAVDDRARGARRRAVARAARSSVQSGAVPLALRHGLARASTKRACSTACHGA